MIYYVVFRCEVLDYFIVLRFSKFYILSINFFINIGFKRCVWGRSKGVFLLNKCEEYWILFK